MIRVRPLFLLAVVLVAGAPAMARQPGAPQPVFTGQYADLTPEQKLLVDDWCRRFMQIMKTTIDPAEAYDNLPLSSRTTFNAVTHALMRTALTDRTGASLGTSALSLVAAVDDVSGMIPGASGDAQFRLFVQLRPGAIDLLEKSDEFGRSADNTVFHKGYPVSYRSRGGVPSVQVSITRDGNRADIDVDYRSSKFPVFLINGHLSASNSDVRAGDNDVRHTQRWTGLNNWWRNRLGLLTVETDAPPSTAPQIPDVPKIAKNAAPDVAIYSFLNMWLVEQRPEEVVPYFADEALECMQLQSDKPLDHGMARFSALISLRKRNEQLGKIAAVSDVVEGVEMPGVRVRRRAHAHEGQFVLYEIREDLVEQLKCVNRLDPSRISAKALTSTSYNKYVAAIFRLKTGPSSGDTTATIWAREGGYWRLVTFINEPQVEVRRALKVAIPPAPPVPSPQMVDADPALIRAAADFHTQWFVRGDVAKAIAYLSPACLACVNAYVEDGVPEPKTAAEQEARLREGMTRSVAAGKVQRLTEAIKAPAVSHPDIKLVRQPNGAAFAMGAIPDSMFAQLDCARTEADRAQAPRPSPDRLVYGNYYATGFKLARTVGDPAVVLLVWARADGAWKVVAFAILTA